ncbi:DMT family transporter [Frigidibacter sp. ROC022]|uniref:DMT family transporter n=1 Tax=Frigidibacter sp. ROC022 TaxID=2971796 RepID=UPI00215AA9D9|nr:DMT family transporter [Frigidibacter sp. ROC022]MCR8724001.1 DMT family transporter [Frigidibacter sp. ROC022]
MLPDTLRHATVMFAAGVGIPILAAINAQLGARIGAPFAAGAVLFVVAFLVALVSMLLLGQGGALAKLPAQPPHLFLGGCFVAFYVLSITVIAPRFGVGNAVMMVLLGQLVSAAVIDAFGLFGARVIGLSAQRMIALLLMAVGVVLAQTS